jgi:hypothetical protein
MSFLDKWLTGREEKALSDAGLVDPSRFHCRRPVESSIVEMLAASPTLKVFQFHDVKPNEQTLRLLNDLLFSNRKDITLRVYGYSDTWADINFLRSLPELERFDFDTKVFGSNEPLYSLKRLVHLGLGFTQPKPKITIEFLADFAGSIESLSLEGDYRDLRNTIPRLSKLNTVWFSSTKLENLEFLDGLKLRTFGNYGGRVKNFECLRRITTLKRLWLKTNATLESIDFVEDLLELESLELYYLAKIKSIPRLDKHKKIQRVMAYACNRLSDISSLKSLPASVKVLASGNALRRPYVSDSFSLS